MYRLALSVALWACVVTPPLAQAENQPPPVKKTIRVIDGNTLYAGSQSIRLKGIDALEQRQICRIKGQNWQCGRRATFALSRRISKGVVRCDWKTTDRHGRAVAVCRAGDLNLNAWMVSEGWALPEPEFAEEFAEELTSAETAGKGMWRGEFITPADWRDGVRMWHLKSSDAPSGNCAIKGAIHPSGVRVFYPPGDRAYNKVKIDVAKGERWFCSVEEARSAGWIPAIP